jgi:hypothetical protein
MEFNELPDSRKEILDLGSLDLFIFQFLGAPIKAMPKL